MRIFPSFFTCSRDTPVGVEKPDLGQSERLLGDSEETCFRENARVRWKTILLRIFEVFWIVVSIVMFASGLQWRLNTDLNCMEHQSFYSPALKQIDNNLKLVQFNGSLAWPSPYRGPPSPEVDAAWDKVSKVYPGSSPLEEVLLSGGTADDVRLPEDLGGGYMTNLEVIHQLHCLNLLRKATHFDYYKDKGEEFLDSPRTLRLHIDHCIEITRQQIMCHADVGLMTSHWTKHYSRPYTNFNTWHKCRNFDEVLDYAYARQVPRPLPAKYNNSWPMLPGSRIWDDPPQPGEKDGVLDKFGL